MSASTGEDEAQTGSPLRIAAASVERTDAVEAALAEAIARASVAGQWTAVEVLARELEARRKARDSANVVAIGDARRRR